MYPNPRHSECKSFKNLYDKHRVYFKALTANKNKDESVARVRSNILDLDDKIFVITYEDILKGLIKLKVTEQVRMTREMIEIAEET